MKSYLLSAVMVSQLMFSSVYSAECTVKQVRISNEDDYRLVLEDVSCLDEYIKNNLLVNHSSLDDYVGSKIDGKIENKVDDSTLDLAKKNIEGLIEKKADQIAMNTELAKKANKSEVTEQLDSLGSSVQQLSDTKANTESVVMNNVYEADKAVLEKEISQKADKNSIPKNSELADEIYTTLSKVMLPYMVKVINPENCSDVAVGVPSPFEQNESFSETFVNERVGDLLLAPILARHDDAKHLGNIIFSKIQGEQVSYFGPIISITTPTHAHLNPKLTCNGNTDFSDCLFQFSNEKIKKIDEHTLKISCI